MLMAYFYFIFRLFSVLFCVWYTKLDTSQLFAECKIVLSYLIVILPL